MPERVTIKTLALQDQANATVEEMIVRHYLEIKAAALALTEHPDPAMQFVAALALTYLGNTLVKCMEVEE